MEEYSYGRLLRKQLGDLLDANEGLLNRVEQLKAYIRRSGYEVPSPNAGMAAPLVEIENFEPVRPAKRLRTGISGSYVSGSQDTIPWDVLEHSISKSVRSAIGKSGISLTGPQEDVIDETPAAVYENNHHHRDPVPSAVEITPSEISRNETRDEIADESRMSNGTLTHVSRSTHPDVSTRQSHAGHKSNASITQRSVNGSGIWGPKDIARFEGESPRNDRSRSRVDVPIRNSERGGYQSNQQQQIDETVGEKDTGSNANPETLEQNESTFEVSPLTDESHYKNSRRETLEDPDAMVAQEIETYREQNDVEGVPHDEQFEEEDQESAYEEYDNEATRESSEEHEQRRQQQSNEYTFTDASSRQSSNEPRNNEEFEKVNEQFEVEETGYQEQQQQQVQVAQEHEVQNAQRSFAEQSKSQWANEEKPPLQKQEGAQAPVAAEATNSEVDISATFSSRQNLSQRSIQQPAGDSSVRPSASPAAEQSAGDGVVNNKYSQKLPGNNSRSSPKSAIRSPRAPPRVSISASPENRSKKPDTTSSPLSRRRESAAPNRADAANDAQSISTTLGENAGPRVSQNDATTLQKFNAEANESSSHASEPRPSASVNSSRRFSGNETNASRYYTATEGTTTMGDLTTNRSDSFMRGESVNNNTSLSESAGSNVNQTPANSSTRSNRSAAGGSTQRRSYRNFNAGEESSSRSRIREAFNKADSQTSQRAPLQVPRSVGGIGSGTGRPMPEAPGILRQPPQNVFAPLTSATASSTGGNTSLPISLLPPVTPVQTATSGNGGNRSHNDNNNNNSRATNTRGQDSPSTRRSSAPVGTSTPAPRILRSRDSTNITTDGSSVYASALSSFGNNSHQSTSTPTRNVSFRLPNETRASANSSTETIKISDSRPRLPRLPQPETGASPASKSHENPEQQQQQQQDSALHVRRRLKSHVYAVDDSQASLPEMSYMQVNPADISEVRGRPRSLD